MNEPTSKLGMIDRMKVAFTGQLPAQIQEPKDKARAALVKDLNEWWVSTRKFWKPVYDRMNEDIQFAAGQHWPHGTVSCDGQPYQVDLLQRYIQQREAALFAKNPTFDAKRRERREFSVWDGTQESLKGAFAIVQAAAPQLQAVQEAAARAKQATEAAQMVQQSGVALSPEHQAQAAAVIQGAQDHVAQAQAQLPPQVIGAQKIIEDYQSGMMQKAYEEAVGDTWRLAAQHQIENQNPPFKAQAKQAITRVTTTGVAFAKIMLKRDMAGTPTSTAINPDREALIESIEAKKRLLSMPGAEPDDAANEELKLMEEQLAQEQAKDPQNTEEVESEAVVIDWLTSTSVIVDRNCRSLRGFVGCKRIAHEMLMEVRDVEREFKVDLTNAGAASYYGRNTSDPTNRQSAGTNPDDKEKSKVCVAWIYDIETQLCYVVCDGVKDFLSEPYSPKPDWDYFWPIVPLVFRPIEVEENKPDILVTCYPKSDVRIGMPMQMEANRAGEAFKQHRIANRPRFVALGTRWMAGDLEKLAMPAEAFSVLRIETLNPGEKIGDFLQLIPSAPVDPNLYNTDKFYKDFLLALGSQEANLGTTVGHTATETNVAEGSRQQGENSNIEDMDAFLTLLVRGVCALFSEFSEETFKKIVGPGAVFPQLSMQSIAENIWLEIQAGSSGPPNQQMEIQVAQKMIPLLVQIPGISPELIARFGVRAFDPRVKLEDFYDKNAASIQALAESKPPAAPPPQEKLSISYSDVPPSVQRQMEIAAGFKPATEMDGTVHMDAFKKEKPVATVTP